MADDLSRRVCKSACTLREHATAAYMAKTEMKEHAFCVCNMAGLLGLNHSLYAICAMSGGPPASAAAIEDAT